MDTDLLTQVLQYIFGLLPANIAGDVAVIITLIVTLCTLILRFWKEPKTGSKWHSVWTAIHLMASFRLPQKQPIKTDAKGGDPVPAQQNSAG